MASSQGTPTKPGRRPTQTPTPTKSPAPQVSDFKFKISELNEKSEKFILRARVMERTQLHKTTTKKEEKKINLIRLLLSDATGSIGAYAFPPKAEQLAKKLKVGEVYDFSIQKAFGKDAKNPVKAIDEKYAKPGRVKFELCLNSQAKFVLVDASCPSIELPEVTFVESIQSRLDINRKLDAFEHDGRFNVMGIVKDIYELCKTTEEEETEGNQFDFIDQSCQKVVVSEKSNDASKAAGVKVDIPKEDNPTVVAPNADGGLKTKTPPTVEASHVVAVSNDSADDNRTKGCVSVIGVGAEVVKRLKPGNIVILIGAYIENETIFSDNESWIQVIEASFNKKSSELHDWSETKEKDQKKKKV